MARTTAKAVVDVLAPGKDYDTVLNPSLQPFIDAANSIVNRVKTCAIAKGLALSTSELEIIERWLAAHYYVQSDQTYASKNTSNASASFQGKTEKFIEGSKYGQAAINLDYSGCLSAISKRTFASATWYGKPPSAQIDYKDRS